MIRIKGEGNTKRSKLRVRVEVGNGPSYLGKLKVALQFGHLFHLSHLHPRLTLDRLTQQPECRHGAYVHHLLHHLHAATSIFFKPILLLPNLLIPTILDLGSRSLGPGADCQY